MSDAAPHQSDDPAQRPSASGPTVSVRYADDAGPTDRAVTAFLRTRLVRLLAALGLSRGELSVAIVGDARMAQLHRQTTGIGGTTDVLTFDLRETDRERGERGSRGGRGVIEAELVLCIDEARRQSATRGHEARVELLLYALHGLLHLTGYDDHTAAGAALMHAREDELLATLGLPPVYHAQRRPTGVGGARP